jgi:cysteine desulfuration protein SufE
MSIAESRSTLISDIERIRDPHHRFAHVIARGSIRLPIEPGYKCAEFRLSQDHDIWLVPEIRSGRCYFRVDAASMIMRSVASLICEFYSGHTPEDILACAPILDEIGVSAHLAHNPSTGLDLIEPAIRKFARIQRPDV